MPISLTCQCGKALRLKDEWVGKKAKCPGCGATFIVPTQGNAPIAQAPAAKTAAPAGAGLHVSKRPQQEEGIGAHIALSPMTILWIAVAIAVPVLIYLAKVGPVNAMRTWSAREDSADSEVRSVVTKAIQGYLSKETSWNPADPRHQPGVTAVTFDVTLLFKVPETVNFTGRSTQGTFKGSYDLRNGDVKALVACDGKELNVTGRVKQGDVQAEIDGKEAKLIYKPRSDLD